MNLLELFLFIVMGALVPQPTYRRLYDLLCQLRNKNNLVWIARQRELRMEHILDQLDP